MDFLGFFDGLFSIFSTVRAGKEVNEHDSQHIEPVSSTKIDKEAQALAQRNEQSKQRRKSRLNDVAKEKHLSSREAEQKAQIMSHRNKAITAQRKSRLQANKKHSLDMER